MKLNLSSASFVTHQYAFNSNDGYYCKISEYSLMEIIQALFKNTSNPIAILDNSNRNICYVNDLVKDEFSGSSILGKPFDDIIEIIAEDASHQPLTVLGNQWFTLSEKVFRWEDDEYILVEFNHPDHIPTPETVASWKNMIAVMLHRFRSPLTGMSGYLELLQDYIEDDTYQKYSDAVENGMNHLYDMMDELEVVYHIPTKSERNNTFSAEPHAVFKQVTDGFSADIRKRIQFTIADSNAVFNCNPENLVHILTLLIQNGIDHTPIDENILVSVESAHKITVTTFGNTIDENIADTLFHPFVTTTANNLGIGLTLALLYAKQYNGTLFLSENDMDSGVKFNICFP
jgi:signal transduction histidine kinase